MGKKVKKERNIWKYVLRIILILFGSSLLYVLVCRWVMPPVTLTQLGGFTGGYGLQRDYVSWNDISYNVKLAAIASEDQLFAEHSGFDWKAIDKSMNAKPSKKKKKN